MHLLFLSSLGHHLFTNYMRSTDQLSFKVFGIPVKNVINYLFTKLLNIYQLWSWMHYGVGFKRTLDLGTDISINSHQWEFLWESIPTLGISWRIKSQIWEQIFQSIPTSGNAQIPYKKPWCRMKMNTHKCCI